MKRFEAQVVLVAPDEWDEGAVAAEIDDVIFLSDDTPFVTVTIYVTEVEE